MFKLKLINEAPTVTSLEISKEFGVEHFHVLRNIDNLVLEQIVAESRLGFSYYLDSSGKKNRYVILSKREALILTPFIGGSKSKQAQVMLVDAFLKLEIESKKLLDEVELLRKNVMYYKIGYENAQELLRVKIENISEMYDRVKEDIRDDVEDEFRKEIIVDKKWTIDLIRETWAICDGRFKLEPYLKGRAYYLVDFGSKKELELAESIVKIIMQRNHYLRNKKCFNSEVKKEFFRIVFRREQKEVGKRVVYSKKGGLYYNEENLEKEMKTILGYMREF